MTQLSMQFNLLRTRDNLRTSILSGIGGMSTDDHNTYDLRLSQNEAHTFTAAKLLVLVAAKPLQVVLTFPGGATLTQDFDDLLYLPLACTAVVSNPTRLGYTSPIPLSAVTA